MSSKILIRASSQTRQCIRNRPTLFRALSTSQAESPLDVTNTHYKITLRRSAISLGDRIKGTLEALGIHRRHQTVYHAHTPDIAGKILRVKELVEVENVPTAMVQTKQQQTLERRAKRGYTAVGSSLKDTVV